MKFHLKIWLQIILLCTVFYSCSKDEVEIDYSIETISANPETKFHQLFFINETTAFIVGGQRGHFGSIYKSVDGGQSWELNFYTDRSLYAINFLNDSVGFACGESLILLKTMDQGLNWVDYQFPYYPDQIYDAPLKKIDLVNEKTIYLTGGWYFDRGLIAKSSNRGDWWDWYYFDYEFSDSHFFNVDYGIFSGYGHFIVTSDGAVSFEVMDFKGDFFTSICFLDDQFGFAAGYDGGIYKTENAGYDWQVLINSNSLLKQRIHFNDILMVNADKGIVVGNNGVISLTYDGGSSWKNLNINEALDCYSIYHFGNDELMICCSEGKVIKMNI